MLPVCAGDDVDELLRQLDNAIAAKAQYREAHEQRIQLLKSEYRRSRSPELRVGLSRRLAEAYATYINDSALVYLHRSIAEAEQMGDRQLAARCRSELVVQCTNAMLTEEGFINLGRIDSRILDAEGKTAYYRAAGNLYNVLSDAMSNQTDRTHYRNLGMACQDTLIQLLPPDDSYSLQLRLDRQLKAKNSKEACRLSDIWKNIVVPGSHDEAVMAFYRFEAYNQAGDEREALRSIIRSAICDVETATYDETAIIYLSRILRDRGDTDRAQVYMHYAFDAATTFGAQMKNWMTMDLQSVNVQYEQQLEESNRKMLVGAIALGMLTMTSFFLLYFLYRQRNKLRDSNRQVSAINNELQKINENLSMLNRQKDEANALLNESNIIKEE